MTTTTQAIAQFLTDISVTDYQKTSIINARKDRVVENLATAFPATSDLPFSSAILMGSAAKGTITRPIDDIDVLAVFSNINDAWSSYRFDSKAFLYRVRRAYDGLSTAQVGARGQAVRIFFKNGGHVDVAPVFYHGNDVYGLPSGNGGWINTAPTIANNWFSGRHAELGYNLAPLVRLLKKWNNAHSKRLRSFHLETMTAHTFKTLGSNRQNALTSFFQWAPTFIDVSDPGGQSGTLSSYLSWAERQEVLQALKSAADRASKAQQAEASGDHAEAKRLWKIILGSSFSG
uniref:Valyl-tRNA synthetase n=1 Tax=Arthrobacter sp. J3.49 TaxID=347213 RepID=I3W1Q5_9MICC|nr:nucleotidyltransferase [Arthrobacter sp. J3.49]AFK89532.1 Valyl-tRNA synthetase [Arthrobacter sp. J3.49]